MSPRTEHLPRKAFHQVLEALTDTRIVVLNGARQVGKSTLAEAVAKATEGSRIRYLDQSQTRLAAQDDPAQFLEHEGLLVIDEVQRVPDLWLALKHTVDLDPRPGRFLLTGSARLLGLRSLPDQLPGRAETIELWPLSQGEITGTADGFIDACFTQGPLLPQAEFEPLTRAEYLMRAELGGYPQALKRSLPRRRQRFFAQYIADIISRDVHQVADIRHSQEIRRLLGLLAGQTGGLMNASNLASQLGVSAHTIRRYLAILETVFILRLIPAYSSNAIQRSVGAPKVSFVDTGVAAHLSQGMSHDAQLGGLLENFVLAELGRQLTWCDTVAQLFHYRDRDGYEVDAILEDSAGRVVALEVKARSTVRADDFRGLKLLRKKLGDNFHAGYVLYTGTDRDSFGDRLSCLPISSLWAG